MEIGKQGIEGEWELRSEGIRDIKNQVIATKGKVNTVEASRLLEPNVTGLSHWMYSSTLKQIVPVSFHQL